MNCGPRGLATGRCFLFRNDGNGKFEDVSQAAGIAKSRGYGMTAVAADFDNDGWPDIYVACDSTPSLCFFNNHDGSFREEGIVRGVALNEDGMEQAGMGIGVGDIGPTATSTSLRPISRTTQIFFTATTVKETSEMRLWAQDWPSRRGSSVGARESWIWITMGFRICFW